MAAATTARQTWLAVPERNCVTLPEGLGFEEGVFLACVGSTAYAALRRLEPRVGQTLPR